MCVVQSKWWKVEIEGAHRELLRLRERLGKLEQIENTKKDSNQQEEAQNKPAADKGNAGVEPRADQTALSLSREEIQVIREYIKPPPPTRPPSPPINLATPVTPSHIP